MTSAKTQKLKVSCYGNVESDWRRRGSRSWERHKSCCQPTTARLPPLGRQRLPAPISSCYAGGDGQVWDQVKVKKRISPRPVSADDSQTHPVFQPRDPAPDVELHVPSALFSDCLCSTATIKQ